MNKYKSFFSVAVIISENLESNEWQREMEDIGDSDAEDEMHDKEGNQCVYTYTDIIVTNKKPVNVI